MKKTILLLLIVVSFYSLKAQESSEASSPGKIFIGAKIGYGITNFESTLKSETKFAKMAYDNLSYGVLAGYKLNSLISFQLEGNFAQYGARKIIPTYLYSAQSPVLAPIGTNSVVDHVDMDLFSIDVPVTIKLSLKEGDFSPYIYGGVNYGINVYGRSSIVRKITYNEVSDFQTSTDDITARIISNEFAPIAGCGVIVKMFKLSLFGDVRYKYGFTNLSNVDNGLGFTNTALWVSVGALFDL
jgi:Outer membrane protein beta-barrel domain